MKADLSGKVALVAGSTFGVGKAIAVKLAQNGADIAIHGLSPEGEEPPVVQEIQKLGRRVIFENRDMTDYEEVKQAVNDTIARLGKIDILIGSGGGFAGSQFGLFSEVDPELYLDMVKRQWLGRLYFVRAVLDHMRQIGGGRIVFITSDAGRFPTLGEFLLGGASAALQLNTKVLARELGRWGIRVNSISISATTGTPLTDYVAEGGELRPDAIPGFEKNPEMIAKLGRKMLNKQLFPVTAEDIAETALFLVSDGGNAITGQILSVNGGICFPG